MDAYDGTMTFYVADPTDPIVRAWAGVFPTLFQPMSDMPAGPARPPARAGRPVQHPDRGVRALPRHEQPLTFFDNTDRWTVPDGKTNEQTLPSEAYYVVMRMPGEPKAEFLLLQPMVPLSRPNMIAWVAARNDAAELRRRPGLPVPVRHHDLRAGPDRGADRPGPDHQPPRSRSGTRPAAGSSGAT